MPSDLDLAMSIEGWMPEAETAALIELAAGVPADQVIVEVGTFRAHSSVALALGARRGGCPRVYTLDPHEEFVGPRGFRYGPPDQAAVYGNLTRAGVGDIVNSIGLASAVVAPGWPARNIGLLLVDGDHNYEAVRDDVQAWSPHLAPTAVAVFDDVALDGVRQMMNRLLAARWMAPEGSVGKLAWFRLTNG